MKKVIISLIILILSVGTAKAALPIGFYVGLRGGATVPFDEKNTDFKLDSNVTPFISANAGVRLLRLRGELEYVYRYKVSEVKFSNVLSKNEELSMSSTMVNAYYNIIEIPFLRLFAGGGVGYTSINTKVDSNNGSFSWNAGLGVSFTLAESFSIDAGYRYFNMGDVKISGSSEKMATNDIYVGLRFGF